LTCIYPDQRLRNLKDQQNMYDQFEALVHKKYTFIQIPDNMRLSAFASRTHSTEAQRLGG
jgi:hypothetical protein